MTCCDDPIGCLGPCHRASIQSSGEEVGRTLVADCSTPTSSPADAPSSGSDDPCEQCRHPESVHDPDWGCRNVHMVGAMLAQCMCSGFGGCATPVNALQEALGWEWDADHLVPSATECVQAIVDELEARGFRLVPAPRDDRDSECLICQTHGHTERPPMHVKRG